MRTYIKIRRPNRAGARNAEYVFFSPWDVPRLAREVRTAGEHGCIVSIWLPWRFDGTRAPNPLPGVHVIGDPR